MNEFGKGRAYYLAARSDDRFLNDFYGRLAGELPLPAALEGSQMPRGVTAQARQTETEAFVFLFNFEPVQQTVRYSGKAAVDYFSGKTTGFEITLPPYGYRILQMGRIGD